MLSGGFSCYINALVALATCSLMALLCIVEYNALRCRAISSRVEPVGCHFITVDNKL